MLLREKVSFYLEDFETKPGLIINWFILVIIFLSSAVFVAESYTIPELLKIIFHYFDLVILVIFTIEYLLRFWCAETKIKFLFSIFSLIDLIAILPLFFGLIDIRFIRLLRWFRILRLIRFWNFEVFIFKIRKEDSLILTRSFLILFTMIFIYSGLIYQVEHQTNTEGIKNFFDAFYFSVVTMTTVGFGDVIPLSKTGKILTLVMILNGVMIIPWQIGEFIKQLVKTATHLKNICSSCGLALHDPDANFCKICGTKLEVEN